MWVVNRVQDWAVIKAPTETIAPLKRGDAEKAPVGERLIVYNVETSANRVIGGVDFGGRALNLGPALFRALSAVNAATPISMVVEPQPGTPIQLSELMKLGVLTTEILPLTAVTYGGTALSMPASFRTGTTPRARN